MPHYTLKHLSSTTTHSGGRTAQSVAVAESTTDKGLNPELRHGKEHHNDVFKKRAAPVSVTVRQSIGLSPGSSRMSPRGLQGKHDEYRCQIRIGASPLSETKSAPKPPAAHTTKRYSHHRHHGARRRANHADRLPGLLHLHPCTRHRQLLTSQCTNHGLLLPSITLKPRDQCVPLPFAAENFEMTRSLSASVLHLAPYQRPPPNRELGELNAFSTSSPQLKKPRALLSTFHPQMHASKW